MLHHRRPRTDAELVRAVLQGRTQQFGVLVERYQHLLHHLLLARVSRFEEAEDLAQEAFLRAFRRLDELEEPAKFGPWLRRIGENLACGALRSRRLAQTAVPDWEPGEEVDPEHLYLAQERRDQVWAAIDRLSLEQREAVLLYYLEDYTQEQVAAFLDISVGATKLRLIRARAALREELAAEFDQVAQAVRTRRLRQGFSNTVLSTLPLVPWHLPVGHSLLAGGRLGWTLALGVSLGLGTLGTVLGLGHWQGWWSPPPAVSPQPSAPEVLAPLPGQDLAQIAGEHGIRIVWAPTESPAGAAGMDGSLFGSETLTLQARARQEQALLQGQGGRLVWNFDGPDAQGWRAREMPTGTLPPRVLSVEARDGALRIPLGVYEPGRIPTVVLISPEIGYDARLFDRIEIRLRLVPPAAVRGGLSLTWTTPRNRSFPGQDPAPLRRLSVAERLAAWERRQRGERQPRFALPTRGSWIYGLFWAADTAAVPLGPGWQDLVVEGLHEDPVMGWEGDLVDLRLHLRLTDLRRTAAFGEALDPAAFPRAVEIDRILLRDAHRSLAVNLDPPAARARPAAGSWLGNGRFYPLSQPGLHWPLLGDLDGDGDLDLVVCYPTDNATGGTRKGWVTALNDGNGRFTAGAAQALSNWCGRVEGADLNQDGRLDLVVAQGTDTWLFLNQGHGVFAADRVWADWLYIGRGDVDGDGKVDLVLKPFDEASLEQPVASRASRATLFVNYGQAVFAEQELGAPAATGWSPYALDDFNGDGRAELVWSAGSVEDDTEQRFVVCDGYAHGTWQRQVEIPRRYRPDERAYYLLTAPGYLGDLDADGTWELGVPIAAYAESQGIIAAGLKLHRPAPDTRAAVWLPSTVHLRTSVIDLQPRPVPQVHDLDRDGLFDPLFVDVNYRQGPYLRVLRGQRGDLPVEEGSYLLPAEPRGWAAGDLDGDGAPDVVVVVEGIEGAGVYVLHNGAGTARAVDLASAE